MLVICVLSICYAQKSHIFIKNVVAELGRSKRFRFLRSIFSTLNQLPNKFSRFVGVLAARPQVFRGSDFAGFEFRKMGRDMFSLVTVL